MQSLPIDARVPEILNACRERGAVVVVAEPGAGKTTRVAPAFLDESEGLSAGDGKVLLLEPRRIAARSAAIRIAEERGTSIGAEVGYQVRFEKKSGASTRLIAMTNGVLLRRLQQDPLLEGVGTVVLDEFHERSLDLDLVLGFLQELKAGVREDLKIVVMSATIEAAPIAEFLDAAICQIPGRSHPIAISYRARSWHDPIDEVVDSTIRESWAKHDGHALVFLPGMRDIERTAERIESFALANGALVCKLHGSLPLDEQRRVIDPSKERKIILSTNVAESSLTVDGVDLVIDSGLERVLEHDRNSGVDRLETKRISRHSADQRAGRAGRLGPGAAIRLWSEMEHARLGDRIEPEIARVDLSRAVLELRAWGVKKGSEFAWLDPPDSHALESAERLLRLLGALDDSGSLTSLGRRMAELPLAPRLARLLLEAEAGGCGVEGARLAALLSERDIVPRSKAAGERGVSAESDYFLRLEWLNRPAGVRLDRGAVRTVQKAATDLARHVQADKTDAGDRDEVLARALLLAFPDRVARRRGPGDPRALMVGRHGVCLDRESAVREGEFFVAHRVESRRGADSGVPLATRVSRAWLEELFADSIEDRVRVFFDEDKQKVRATKVVEYLDLPLEAERDATPDADEAGRVLFEAIRNRAESLITVKDSTRGFLMRARCLAKWMPDLDLPEFSGDELEEVLATLCAGKASLRELEKSDFLSAIKGRLEWAQTDAIERHAPETIAVPSGSRVKLEYETGKPPVLAVRLQEMFGLRETPKVAGGRIAVQLHLLGPNFRPVQVTQDLESFWNTTYAAVRKDLRGRYPKHSWPEDPWTAEPMRGAKRRRP